MSNKPNSVKFVYNSILKKIAGAGRSGPADARVFKVSHEQQYYLMATSGTSGTAKTKGRNWCITINNPTADDYAPFQVLPTGVRYTAYADEVGENGTAHIQGYCSTNEPTRLSAMKAIFPRAHLEIMHGTLKQNEEYCTKEGELHENGAPPSQGIRTDLIACKRRLDAGVRTLELAEEEDYFPHVARHSRFFKEYEEHMRAKLLRMDRTMPEVIFRIGTSGAGKTRWMDDTFGLDGWRFVPVPRGEDWWFDHCDERDVVLFDEVHAGYVPPIGLFKQLTDRYPLTLPRKGGFITWKPKTIVVTSNSEWWSWWPKMTDNDRAAIERRITRVDHF